MIQPGVAVADALIAPVWLSANILLACFAWKLSRAGFPGDRIPQSAMAALLVYLGTIVGVVTGAGALGVLNAWLLLVCVAATSTTGIVLLRRRERNSCVSVTSYACRLIKSPRRPRRLEKSLWTLWGVLCGVLIGHIIINGVLTFPAEFDELAYHIPLVDHWLQANSLYAPDAAWWWTAANGELVALWMVAPFSGDFLIALNNLPFIVLWTLGIIETGRLVGLSVVWRHLTALAAVCVHTTFHEAGKAMNDLPVAAFYFATIVYGLRYIQRSYWPDLVFSGVALGLLGGVKYFAVGYALVGVAVIGVAVGMRSTWWRSLRSVALMVLAALPFGGYWYLRNLRCTGAPLYPQGADAAGIGYPHLWKTTFLGNGQAEVHDLTIAALWKMTGPCHFAAVFVLPSAILVIVWCGIARLQRGKRRTGISLLVVAGFLVGAAAVFVCTPFAVEDQPDTLNHLRWAYTPARYGLCFLSMSVLAGVWLLQSGCRGAAKCSARRGARRAVLRNVFTAATVMLFAASIAWQLYERLAYLTSHSDAHQPPEVLKAILLGTGLFLYGGVCGLLCARSQDLRYARVIVVMIVSLGVWSPAVACLSNRWHDGFSRHFDVLRGSTVFSHVGNQATTRAVAVLDHHPYPFFGSQRQHRVCAPRILTTYDELVAYLTSRHVTLVATRLRNTGDVFDRYKQGPTWMRRNEGHFHRERSNGLFELFSFRPGARADEYVSTRETQPSSVHIKGGAHSTKGRLTKDIR